MTVINNVDFAVVDIHDELIFPPTASGSKVHLG